MPFARRPDPVPPRVWARLNQIPDGSDDDAGPAPPVVAPAAAATTAVGPTAVAASGVAAHLGATGVSATDDSAPDRRRERPIRIEVPHTLRTGRWVPPRRAVLGLVVIAVAVCLVFGVRIAWALADTQAPAISSGPRSGPSNGPRATAAPNGVTKGPAADPAADPAAAAAAAAPGTSSAAPGLGGRVVVHVVGAVAQPGLATLPAGSRVADAIAAAGGATPDADLGAINVARLLVDGEQIRVPRPGEVLTGGTPGGTGPGASGGSSGGTGTAGRSGGLISLNAADAATLDSLPGVGPVLAQRIVDWRAAHGRFTSIDELGEVTGIGEKLLAQISPLVTL